MDRTCAESLWAFALQWARQRYGHLSLARCAVWNLAANLAYHQYGSEEVYLFARFFFDDLPADLLLTYLEAFRVCGLRAAVPGADTAPLSIPAQHIPLVIHALLRNWEPKRKRVLAHGVYSALAARDTAPAAIELAPLMQLLLFALAHFRRVVFQAHRLVFQQLSSDASVDIRAFREYCRLLVPQWPQDSVDEVFYVFSDCPGGQVDLEARRMSYDAFVGMFCSMELARFGTVSPQIL